VDRGSPGAGGTGGNGCLGMRCRRPARGGPAGRTTPRAPGRLGDDSAVRRPIWQPNMRGPPLS
jgi:hypothetical protein